MKKLIIGISMFVLFFAWQNAHASVSWNSASNDCDSIAVLNHSTGEGYEDPCWPLSSVSADYGETVNVRIYYHNTGNTTATNTRVVLTSSLNNSTNHSFTGKIISDQGSISFGPVYINTPNTNLSFGSVRWYPNQTQSSASLLYGQSGSEVLNSSGLKIGSIASGWDSQGSVVISFKVGNNNNNDDDYDYDECNINSFYASDTSIDEGDDTTLYWNTTDCDNVTITSLGDVDDDGSEEVSPNSDKTYVIKAYNSDGSYESDSVKIYVDGDNDDNDNDDNDSNCKISSFKANNKTDLDITAGEYVKLYWNTNGCDEVFVSGPNFYSTYLDGSEVIYPYASGTYTIKAYDEDGDSVSKKVYINIKQKFIQNIFNPNPTISNSCAITTVATNVGKDYATLNGLTSGGGNSNVYFEYGTSTNFGMKTSAKSINSGQAFSETISGLLPNTIYFFRLVSDCNNNSFGTTEIFRTTSGMTTYVNNTKTVVQGTTVVGVASPIMLKIENKYESIARGDIVDYTVTYKNISKMKLTNPVLQVIAPRDILLKNASRGTYASETNTFSVLLEDLNPGNEGVVYIQGEVKSISAKTAKIVTTAVLVYTTPGKAQENAIAYVLNIPKDFNNNTLGAAAFFGGIIDLGLIGWLLLIILILIIILISKSIKNKNSHQSISTHQGH